MFVASFWFNIIIGSSHLTLALLPDTGAYHAHHHQPCSLLLYTTVLPRGPPSRVVDLQQFWPSRHPRSSSLRLPARCFRLHRLSIALHQSQLYFKPKSRTQHMSFTSSSTTNPNPNGSIQSRKQSLRQNSTEQKPRIRKDLYHPFKKKKKTNFNPSLSKQRG